MPETKYLLILANSVRREKYCVAGKVATQVSDGKYEVTEQWVRLSDPNEPEGAVAFANTVCQGHGSVRPLDIIKVNLRGHCADADHPEDWHFEPNQRWEFVTRVAPNLIPGIADNPPSLWHEGPENNSVPSGYIRAMGKSAASLCLIKAPDEFEITHHKEYNHFKCYDRKIRKLAFKYGGKFHEYSVTDPAFDRRFQLPGAVSQWPDQPTAVSVTNPNGTFFCLSLTPEFNGKHYKICATIF